MSKIEQMSKMEQCQNGTNQKKKKVGPITTQQLSN
jgi:hypothetical protein